MGVQQVLFENGSTTIVFSSSPWVDECRRGHAERLAKCALQVSIASDSARFSNRVPPPQCPEYWGTLVPKTPRTNLAHFLQNLSVTVDMVA